MSSEEFRAEWAVYVARVFLNVHRPEEPAAVITFEAGGDQWRVVADRGALKCGIGLAEGVDTKVTGDPQMIMGLLSGVVGLDAALAAGVKIDSDAAALRRVLPTLTAPA
jgi:hypothetical protein